MDKEYKKYKRYGFWAYCILKVFSKTFRSKVEKSRQISENENYVYVFWHNKLLIASVFLDKLGDTAVLASPSKDGEIVSTVLEKYGYEVIRGSSDKQAVKGLVTLLKKLKKGYNIGTPVDGPKGPIYEVKPGMLYLAQKSGTKIIPVGGAFSKKWTFEKAWDRFEFPKPFSKLSCVLGDPIEVEKGRDIEEYSEIVKEEISRLDARAQEIIEEKW